jgi:aldehyde dehydrogenase (NAD+)
MAIFDYAPAPESRDIARLKPSYQIFVDGSFRDGTGDAVKTINPADESPLAEVAEAGPSDVDDAVAAARRAAPKWAALPGKERGKYLFRVARAIQERGRELAVLESLDNGKPIKESRDVDIPTAAAHFF